VTLLPTFCANVWYGRPRSGGADCGSRCNRPVSFRKRNVGEWRLRHQNLIAHWEQTDNTGVSAEKQPGKQGNTTGNPAVNSLKMVPAHRIELWTY
jgi:hypothetical protein